MANYLTTDTDLTAVADAIRTKGGTSGQLAFPVGFVNAIASIVTGGGGLDYDIKTVTVSNDTPKVDRAFDNFVFIAQTEAKDIPAVEERGRLKSYLMLFVYLNGTFMVTEGGRGLAVTTPSAGSSQLRAATTGMGSTSVGETSITFSNWTTQYMQHGEWKVLQIEIPSEAGLYSFTTVQ